jgi:hypothetical protein
VDPNITRVNRIVYSWTSCTHFFAGFPYKGVVGVTFKDTREPVLVNDAAQDGVPIGMTSGLYKVENVSFTLLRDSAAALMTDLTVLGLGSYGDAEFSYMLQVFEPITGISIPQLPQTTLISGCRVTGVEDVQEKGSDAILTKFDVMAIFITRTIAGVPLQLQSLARQLL